MSRSRTTALALAVATATTPARAQPGPSDAADPFLVRRAEELFREGAKLFDDKQTERACSAFGASYDLDPHLGTLLNLAYCHDALGKTATAFDEYALAIAWAVQRGQDARMQFAVSRQVEVAKRLSRVVLDLPADAVEYAIAVDDRAVPPSRARLPLFVDPGAHTITVSAPARRPQSIAVVVATGPSSQNVAVPKLAAASEGASRGPEPLPPAAPSTGTRTAIGAIATGAGVVALGIGAYFGVRAFQKKDDASAECTPDGACSSLGVDLGNDAHRSATVSTIAFAAGGASLVAGLWLLLARTAPATAHASWVRFAPSAAPGVVGLEARW